MKRMHVNLSVTDLAESIRFYSALFDAAPTVEKNDYAKWMLDDPRVNFAISTQQCGAKGISHLGIQAENDDELSEVFARLERAGGETIKEEAQCCYATSTKQWIKDPEGVAWETFLTRGELAVYGSHQIPGTTTR
ncbi:MAG: ArsI/CadI family heavy metal resistance metalloenzyme [Gammaproteobacteria bacterium]